MRARSSLAVAGPLVAALACGGSAPPGGTPVPAAPAAGAAAVPAVPAVPDSLRLERERYVREVMQEIAGHETEPAEAVFKNIQLLKGQTAQRVVQIMNAGYSTSLGVSCTHCHIAGEWAREDKPTKQVTRDMAAMVRTINTQLLPAIKNLRSPSPAVTCSMCHRGQARPGARG